MMMRQPRYGCFIVISMVVAFTAGCREKEPPRSYQHDVGADGVVLLPTTSSWIDPAVMEGRADWIELREPDFSEVSLTYTPLVKEDKPAVAEDAAVAVAGSDAIETELRELLAEYNDLVEQEKYEELLEFFVADQGEIAEQMLKVIPPVAAKLKELHDALPEPDEQFDIMLASFSLKEQFHLEVESIHVTGDTAATGMLKISPVATGVPDALRRIRFTFDEEYWYIDVPALNKMKQMLPVLEQSISVIDQLIAGIESGSVAGQEAADLLEKIVGMFSQMQNAGENAVSAHDNHDDE